MKFYMLLVCCVTSLLLLSVSAVSFAEDERAYMEVLDRVYEWSPNGTSIQVGDYNISDFGTVWMDKGNGDVVQTNSNDIKTGGLVRVYLVNEDENGFWIADRLVVLSGAALNSAIMSLPDDKKKEFEDSQKDKTDNPPPKHQTKEPVYENGVWKN